MTRSVSGRAEAEEQWERRERGGSGVDRTGWGRGEVSRRAKAGLKGKKKKVKITEMCVHVLTQKDKLSELVYDQCKMLGCVC